ncbi:hypothetical protein UFOVP1665_20 [uncultured Caudovirales phage]|uniref:Uncharacterized protein n=1 Tax=uncultured Caudovirales phage TaxID=2100421 RepID=A0A6J5T7P8_9CAUD|nr:hypothetical protein UFOVP1665_20 [uncultured Caudovirales phage]
MTASSISGLRATLATALGSVAASVYSSVPEAIIPPACVIVPDSPYLESTLINGSTVKMKINFIITAAVAYNSNAGALDNLEKLIISILAVLPAGYVVGDVQRPTITSVGASNLLIADLNVSTYYTQTN